jgi:hypothetical protein
MSQVLALITQDSALLKCELDRVRSAFPLSDRSVSGIGAWQEGQVVQRTFGAGVAADGLWEAPESEIVLLGARALGVGQDVETAAQPFRFRNWLFAAAGELERASAVRERVWNELPEFLQGAVKGPTWEEAAFVRFLAELRAAGRMEDPNLDATTAANAMASCAKGLEQVSAAVGVTARPKFAFVASNGRLVVAARRGGQPLSYLLLEGRAECARHGLAADARDGESLVRDHRRRRSVVVSSAPGEGWVALPETATLAIDRKLTITVR